MEEQPVCKRAGVKQQRCRKLAITLQRLMTGEAVGLSLQTGESALERSMAPERAGGDLRVSPEVVISAAELQWRFSRSSGAGGQHVNTTDSRVELVFDLAASEALPPLLKTRALRRLEARLVAGTVVIAVQEQRSQWQNRATALRRLAALLQEAIQPPPPPRRPTRPSRGSRQRRLAAKRLRSSVKGQRRAVQPED